MSWNRERERSDCVGCDPTAHGGRAGPSSTRTVPAGPVVDPGIDPGISDFRRIWFRRPRRGNRARNPSTSRNDRKPAQRRHPSLATNARVAGPASRTRRPSRSWRSPLRAGRNATGSPPGTSGVGSALPQRPGHDHQFGTGNRTTTAPRPEAMITPGQAAPSAIRRHFHGAVTTVSSDDPPHGFVPRTCGRRGGAPAAGRGRSTLSGCGRLSAPFPAVGTRTSASGGQRPTAGPPCPCGV
jgi:hypothetical protein